MRSKKAIINSIVAIIGEIVSIICGFILPRLILSRFGSTYNGITSSISQFISCVVLLRAGVGGVTRAALYKPLAEKDEKKISGIVNATTKFMRKIAFIFAGFLVIFATIYPIFVNKEFDWLFSFSLVLILGISTFAQNYFGISYGMLIEADQKKYIYTILSIFTTILNTIVASILILMGSSIHIVKLGSAIVFALNPIVLSIYVKKRYKIDRNVPPDNIAISQRWDAFAQQVAAFVNNNTDIMVLTIFTNLKEVSVYTVYQLITNGLYKVENTICSGIEAAFGNMIAKEEDEALRKNISIFEFLIFATSAFLFISGAILCVPFVMLYTSGVEDVSYKRYFFGILTCINQFIFCARLPYQMVVEAAGHFKQTKKGAIFEAIFNIVVSVTLVIKLGLIGVTIGTFCALTFRFFQYSIYASKNILKRSMRIVARMLCVTILEAITVTLIVYNISNFIINSYFDWIIYAIIIAIIVIIVILFYSILFCRKELKLLLNKILQMVKKKK